MIDRNVVNVASSKHDSAPDQIGALARGRINTFRMGQTYLCGVVVGHRIGENRGCGHPGIACIGAVRGECRRPDQPRKTVTHV